jgi:hypothetical protein
VITNAVYENSTLVIDRPNGIFGIFAAGTPSLNPCGSWLIHPPDLNGIDGHWGNSTPQKITTCRIKWNAGSINGGKVYMLRRLDYLSLAIS